MHFHYRYDLLPGAILESARHTVKDNEQPPDFWLCCTPSWMQTPGCRFKSSVETL